MYTLENVSGALVLSAAIAAAFCPATSAQTFTDVTSSAGLQYNQYATVQLRILQQHYFTGGAAAADYDGDGWIDLYCTRMDNEDLLYRNQGDGTFAAVSSQASGISRGTGSNGAAWADIDNDGDPDLYVTTVELGRNFLYVNNGDGTFSEQAQTRGVDVQRSASNANAFSCTFGDYDRDGYLDLHVCAWEERSDGAKLFRNTGGGTPGFFTDVTAAAGVTLDNVPNSKNTSGIAYAFASHFSDLDGDGWPELVVAGDFEASRLFWNDGDGTFTDGTLAAGVGTDENGMGSAVGDIDGDGLLDWFVTSIFDVPENADEWGVTGNRLYRNNGDRTFTDITDLAGVRAGGWGWGAAMFDYDNDGDLDITMTNGIDLPFSAKDNPFNSTPLRLWRNRGDGTFEERSAAEGMRDRHAGKGLLTLDYDNDGDRDVFVVNNGAEPVLYRNAGHEDRGWLDVRLTGTASNRAGIGARVRVVCGDAVHVREVRCGAGFLGQSAATAHFGLGEAASVDSLTVSWPSGTVDVHTCVDGNRILELTEGIVPEPEVAVGFTGFDRGGHVELIWRVCGASQVSGFKIWRRVQTQTPALLTPTPISFEGDAAMSFVDFAGGIEPGTELGYRLEAVLNGGNTVSVGSEVVVVFGADVPPSVVVNQNAPNPFKPPTTISFGLSVDADVLIEVFSADGRLVTTLVDRFYSAGTDQVEWDGTGAGGDRVPAGVYFYRFRAAGRTLTRKMVLLR